MQTFPTHAVVGVLIGEVAIATGLMGEYNAPFVWFVGISGAIAPDMVMVPMFLRDKLAGRQPMTEQGPLIMMLKELSHSIPLWTLMLALSFCIPHEAVRDFTVLFLVSGIFGGVLPDIPTHSDERFRDTDCTFLYPLGSVAQKLIGTDTLRWKSNRWEYRYDHGVLWPLKPWERTFAYTIAILAMLISFL